MIEPLPIATVRDGDRIDLSADEKQCAAIAERHGLLSLDRFEAHAVLRKDGKAILAEGRVKACASQACVATGQPVAADIDEAFSLRFLPVPDDSGEEEIELGEDELDTVFHDGRSIALGDALADTLALALDPYPRCAEAEAHLKEAGVLGEEDAGPFGALAELKKKMEGKE